MNHQSEKNSEINLTGIFIKLKNEYFPSLMVILPIFLIIGISYQFFILMKIDKLNFFSWSQVINDTVSLFFPIGFGILGILLGINIRIDKWKDFILDILGCSIAAYVILLVIQSFNAPILYKTFQFGYISFALIKTAMFMDVLRGSKQMKSNSHRKLLTYLGIMICSIAILYVINEYQYKDTYIKIENNEEKIIYMNDKYIITKNKVIHNKDDLIFYYK